MSKNTTTKRPRQDYGVVQHSLLVGSVLATLAGAWLLRAQEVPTASLDIGDQPPTSNLIIIAPPPIPLPAPQGGGEVAPLELNLAPIPTLVAPQPFLVAPVARSRSSR